MPLSRKEQPRYLIIMGIDIRKCQFAPNTACTGENARHFAPDTFAALSAGLWDSGRLMELVLALKGF